MEHDEKYYEQLKHEVDESMAETYRGCFITSLWMVLLAFIAMLALSSCKSIEYVPVIEHHTDTLIQTKVLRDSVYLKDSTMVETKGDTVRIEHWHTQIKTKEVHDTVYQSKTDTVPKPYPIIEYEEKPLTWWQRTIRDLGYLTLGAIIIGILLLILKFTKR